MGPLCPCHLEGTFYENYWNILLTPLFIRDRINISANEEYVDIDSYNEEHDNMDNVTINSDDAPDSIEEDDSSKF